MKPVHPKGNQPGIFIERLILKLKLQSFGHLVNLKISCRLKAVRVLFSEKILGLQAWETTSQGTLRDCCEEVGEGVRLYASLQQSGQAV